MTMTEYSVAKGLRRTIPERRSIIDDDCENSFDVIIDFQRAENLPKTDIIGHGDPYFIAKIDKFIQHTSKTINDCGSPIWNEKWIVKNIPRHSTLTVKILDEDDDKLIDDPIGYFEIENFLDFQVPEEGIKIIGPFNNHQGNFYLSIEAQKSDDETRRLPRYTFDGPCHFARHDSLFMGILTKVNENLIYSTWKIQLRRISCFFPPFLQQRWNRNHAAAQKIFGKCPTSLASQGIIKAAHKALHGRKLKHYEDGVLNDANDLWKNVFTDRTLDRIKPRIFTYVIDEKYWRFSETSHQFFMDFASKHALLANASKYVSYAGEFHTRPINGWDQIDGPWELVFDNGSGTYSPNVKLLQNLKELFQFNFPSLRITTYNFEDPELKESVKFLKKSKKHYDQLTPTIDKLIQQIPIDKKN